jgi:hypothetical protein
MIEQQLSSGTTRMHRPDRKPGAGQTRRGHGDQAIPGIRQLGKERICMVHVKNGNMLIEEPGPIDWPAAFRDFRQIGYQGWYVYESGHESTEDCIADTTKNNEFLRRHLQPGLQEADTSRGFSGHVEDLSPVYRHVPAAAGRGGHLAGAEWRPDHPQANPQGFRGHAGHHRFSRPRPSSVGGQMSGWCGKLSPSVLFGSARACWFYEEQ